ncbi:hypothetical protein I79_004113 [Cricetulus griseus]|uniref:Uncharacterized protein n=1 Tax=Cricetulus griseus TaxID=10029 RepID=G3H1T0_CRIGR|nr:hypothetical protein I79_004113 [Cricetulus griseus]
MKFSVFKSLRRPLATVKSYSTEWIKSAFIHLPQPYLQGPKYGLGFKGVIPLTLAWHSSGYSGKKAHQQERQEAEPKVGWYTYLTALLGVYSGGRSPGQELGTHLLGGADPCYTASSQESAENVFSL